MKKVIVLGASGNVGEQALKIIKKHNYELTAFSVGESIDKIDPIIERFPSVKAICVKNEKDAIPLKDKYKDKNINVYSGVSGFEELITKTPTDIVLNAIVGFAGLKPTIITLTNNIDLALANKESLVVGGELIDKIMKTSKSHIYPVDSEHSAIYKCLTKCKRKDVKSILITASGGALRHLSREELVDIRVEDALAHPTWKMGKRVTIDSATMLNKGFEVIEAYYLFKFPLKTYKILMHSESFIHSIVELKNHKFIGEVNAPSMLNPIEYSLLDHKNEKDIFEVDDINKFGDFHFFEFDDKRYPMVKYALKALKKGGIIPCVLNAVDEVAVEAFLSNKISFLDIETLVKVSLRAFPNVKEFTYEDLLSYDKKARSFANNYIKEHLK